MDLDNYHLDYKVIVQRYAIFFVLHVILTHSVKISFHHFFFVMYSCTKQSQLFVALMYCHDFILFLLRSLSNIKTNDCIHENLNL